MWIRHYVGVVNTDEDNDMSQLNGFDFQSEGEDQFLNEFTARRMGEGDGTGVSDDCGESFSSAMVSVDSALSKVQETADWYKEQIANLEDWLARLDD
jgi:hypothetical protein